MTATPSIERNTMTITHIDDRADVHTWFGLSYSNYLVLPRTLLQSMPKEWQREFVAKLDELHRAFEHVDQADSYKVEAATEREVGDLTADELARIGYSKSDGCDCYGYLDEGTGRMVHVPPVCPHETVYYDGHGQEVASDHIVLWPMPDPVPHYSRGRTHIEPSMGA
jgi:hypothetical protein